MYMISSDSSFDLAFGFGFHFWLSFLAFVSTFPVFRKLVLEKEGVYSQGRKRCILVGLFCHSNNIIMSHLFKDNYVYLDVKGYIVKESELYFKSSPPLFSWNLTKKTSRKLNLHWGCQTQNKPDRSFWLTELHIVCGRKIDCHYIPGAFMKAERNTWSSTQIPRCWIQFHDGYTFQANEIDHQKSVQTFLKRYITPGTVVFYKGGLLEPFVAELCNATKHVNVEDFGFQEKIDLSKVPSTFTESFCKIHRHNIQHCASQEVRFFLRNMNVWLIEYEKSQDKEWGTIAEEWDNSWKNLDTSEDDDDWLM